MVYLVVLVTIKLLFFVCQPGLSLLYSSQFRVSCGKYRREVVAVALKAEMEAKKKEAKKIAEEATKIAEDVLVEVLRLKEKYEIPG